MHLRTLLDTRADATAQAPLALIPAPSMYRRVREVLDRNASASAAAPSGPMQFPCVHVQTFIPRRQRSSVCRVLNQRSFWRSDTDAHLMVRSMSFHSGRYSNTLHALIVCVISAGYAALLPRTKWGKQTQPWTTYFTVKWCTADSMESTVFCNSPHNRYCTWYSFLTTVYFHHPGDGKTRVLHGASLHGTAPYDTTLTAF